MPIIKSAKKRARQAIVRRGRNNTLKKNLKKTSKQLKAAVDKKSKASVNERLRAYQSLLDTAVKKNYIHRKNAARRLSAAMSSAKGLIETSTRKKSASAKKIPTSKTLKAGKAKTVKKNISKTAKTGRS